MKNYKVLLFYKYVKVENPEQFKDEHLNFCFNNNIKGRVYIAEEGINGTVSGSNADIEIYKKELKSYPYFSNIVFKEDSEEKIAFSKMHVRVKKEIIHSDLDIKSTEEGGKRLTPEELLKFYEEEKDFIIVDARNWYESKIGKFKNAITPQMDNFRDWKKVVDEDLIEYKDKTVVTYCTGGIRCEKASVYMVEQGFKDVYQLAGGIVTYAKQFPDTYWDGSVWVFDDRFVVDYNKTNEHKYITDCQFCGEPTSYYINCHNVECDKIIFTCHNCKKEMDYCCSDECKNAPQKRPRYYG